VLRLNNLKKANMPDVLAIVDERPLAYAHLRHDGKIYNFATEGWDSVGITTAPAAGANRAASVFAMTDNHMKPFVRFPGGAIFADQQSATIERPVSSGGWSWVAVISLDLDGKPSRVIDCWPSPLFGQPVRGCYAS
jgi:hypothetical protein